MERQVKERLIGAAVLVAIAVILIPELLSGPTEKHEPAATASTPTARVDEQGLKTYQFDLSKPGATNGQLTSSNSTPPREETPAEAPPSEQQPAEPPKDEAEPSAEIAAAPPQTETPAPASPPVQAPGASRALEKVAEPVPAPKPAAPTRTGGANSPGFAVQLGSFADTERAHKLMERLRAAGHNAYLVPLRRSDGKTLQRVRIGPYAERAAAEQALKRVSGEAKGAVIVSQP